MSGQNAKNHKSGATPPKSHYHGHRERLRSRFRKDPRTLHDYEVLEMLLGHVFRRGDTKPLAKEMLARFKTLRGVFAATDVELLDIDGCGPACVDFIGLWRETWARLHEAPLRERMVLSSPEAVAELAMARLSHARKEEFWVALVDNKNRLITFEQVSKGTVDKAPVYPREIISLALSHKAKSMVLVHNHPGGDPKPSPQDMELTRKICRSALDLDIRVLDHVIVAEASYYSMQSKGLI